MKVLFTDPIFLTASRFLIAGVWVFHGFYSKILSGIPRHQQIVGKILGERVARPATLLIGFLEICVGLWALSGEQRVLCAIIQSVAILAMNTLEITLAKNLLISAWGMVLLNLLFLVIVWNWALT